MGVEKTIWDQRYKHTSLDLRVVWELAYHVHHIEDDRLDALVRCISDYKGYSAGIIHAMRDIKQEKWSIFKRHPHIKEFLEEGGKIAIKAEKVLSEFETELERIKKILNYLLDEIGETLE